jgi:hypothetical protein
VKHSIEWHDDAKNAAPEERATVGDLRLFINEQNVTQHLLDGKVGDHITAALYGLAHGLAHDWWTIFGMREGSISLRRYRSGFLIPDIRFQFDGAAFEIIALQCSYVQPDLRFWSGGTEVLTRAEAEAKLSNLIEEILARLSSKGIAETSAAMRWRRVKASCESDEAQFCEAAGSLGLDPYQVPEEAADFIEKAETVFKGEALIEFVSGASTVDRERLFKWTSRMAGSPNPRYRLAELRAVVKKVARKAPLGACPAWALGYRRAREMRRVLGLKQHFALKSFRHLARHFGAGQSYNLAPKVDGIQALRQERDDGTHVFLRNHGGGEGAQATHLFALARAVGDAACFPDAMISPVNTLQHAFRQAAGRAFAAEFLAPIDEIRSMYDDGHDQFSIAQAFGVSSVVVERQLENQQRIEAACAPMSVTWRTG